MDSKYLNALDGSPKEQGQLEKLLTVYEDAALVHTAASINPDHRKANKSHDIIVEVVAKLKELGELSRLRQFLAHPSDGVRVWAASHLLATDLNREAVSTLEQVAQGKDVIAFAAEMTLSEWAKGNLRT